MPDPLPPVFLATAVESVIRAGEIQMAHFGGAMRVDKKGAIDLVTEIDLRVEREFRALIADRFPDHVVLGEEFSAVAERDAVPEHCWVFDPVDGTTNYAHGIPIFAVSIALEAAGRVQLGVIYDPNHDELFVAERGGGAFVNDRTLAVSSAPTLDESVLVSGFPYNLRETTDNNVAEFSAFSLRAQGVRRMGSAVLYLAWLAAGRFDGYWELRTGPWDVAAGGLLVEEAGGRVTALDGGPLDLDRPAIVASNGRIHGEMLKILAEVRSR